MDFTVVEYEVIFSKWLQYSQRCEPRSVWPPFVEYYKTVNTDLYRGKY